MGIGKKVFLLPALIMILLFLDLSSFGVFALPGIPHQIYGSVSVDSIIAPDGTIVQAKIGEDVYSTATSSGKFGYAPNVFFIEDPDGIRAGKNIEIFVNYKKIQDLVFENGVYTNLDINTNTTCGDSYCLGSETCSSCGADCGACPAPPANAGGGGGGGGGGGSSSGGSVKNLSVGACIEQWECSEWNDCKDGKQKRLCRDNNNCKTEKLKPYETRDCIADSASVQNKSNLIESSQQKEIKPGILGAVIGAAGVQGGIALGFIILIVAAGIIVMVIRRNRAGKGKH